MGIFKVKCGGIYKIEHIPTNQYYIGKSVNIFDRWSSHYTSIKTKKHTSTKLEELLLNGNLEDFTFTILEQVSKTLFKQQWGFKGKELDKQYSKELIRREKHWMSQHSVNFALNKNIGHFSK